MPSLTNSSLYANPQRFTWCTYGGTMLGSTAVLSACLALLTAVEARSARALRICIVSEPGFNEFTETALAKYVAAGTVDEVLRGPKASVGERGLVVLESDLKGYMHEQRKLMFTGTNSVGQAFGGDNSLWKDDTYVLHMYPSYGALIYYTRAGFCQMGWNPVTVKPSREACSPAHCPNVASAKNTASLAPEVSLPVVALGAVEAGMSCCIDFPQTTVSTGLAVSFRRQLFAQAHWFQKTAVHNIVILMLLFILVAAHAIWFFERLTNPNFPRRYLAGIDDAMWFSAVTVTTVGCGELLLRRVAACASPPCCPYQA